MGWRGGNAGATDIVNCSLCAAGTFLTGSGVHAGALMISMPSQHEPEHVLALAMFRSSSMEAGSWSIHLFYYGLVAKKMTVCILMLYLRPCITALVKDT